jgi:phasin family protein
MINKPEQIVAVGKAQLDATVRFATIAAEGAERMLELHLENAKSGFNETIRSARALSELKDISELATWAGTSFQPSLDKAAAYAKSFYDVTTGTQREISALIEGQVTEFNKTVAVALDAAVKSAPAGSESAVAAAKSVIEVANSVYDTISKATKQLSSLPEANIAGAGSKKKAA